MDRPDFWRHVEHDYKHALEHRPAGYLPVALVWIAGRPEPLEIGFVETRKTPHGTIARLQSGWEPQDGSALPIETWWYHAPASSILGAEIVYVREGTGRIPPGFATKEYEEDE